MEKQYDRDHPFLATLTERYSLCKEGSQKRTLHMVLNIKGSGIRYKVGDSVGICPTNDPQTVAKTLKALKASGSEQVADKKGRTFLLREYLAQHANLKTVSKKLAQEVWKRAQHSVEESKEWLLQFEVWDFLEMFPAAAFSAQEIVDLLMPLLPRFYSIASSQSLVGDEIHLTVSYLNYETQGVGRVGVCTHYLSSLAPLGEPCIPIYIHPSHDFHLPEDHQAKVIMIGPGTGVAPFRAFMQEREARGHEGENWLFFGEWTKEKEYFYQEDWERWESLEKIRLSLAFSRDQVEKIYVQHLMEKNSKEFYRWLTEGAYLYVCGDAHRMAKDVETTLHRILMQEGGMGEKEAHDYIKRLRQEKRYLRDVY